MRSTIFSIGFCIICGMSGFGSAGSVEQLPVDRFDEYISGTFPPHPWQMLGTVNAAVTLTLESSGESPFISNHVTGKGLVFTDKSTNDGDNQGAAYAFIPPPPGDLFLGFDMVISAAAKRDNGCILVCELTDDSGRGIVIRMDETGGVTAGANNKAIKRIAPLHPGVWHRVTVRFLSNGKAVVTVTNTLETRVHHPEIIELGDAGPYQRLRFYSDGGAARTGSWSLDNVLMAGKVDAPRDELLPMKKASVETLRRSPKKVIAYYYEIYTSKYTDEDPGLIYYSRTLFNPAASPADRKKAGTELLFRPMPRPQMAPGMSKDDVLLRAMEEEVRLAINAGIDGFLTDLFAFPESYPNPASINEFNRRSFALFDAAGRVDPGFKIIPAVYAGGKPPVSAASNADSNRAWASAYAQSPVVRKALTHPQAWRDDRGRTLFSCWGTERRSAAWWKDVCDDITGTGIANTFMAQVNGLSAERLAPYTNAASAMADWGIRTPIEYRWIERARPLTKTVVSPVVMQDVRTRECIYWEACGSDLLRRKWRTAIEKDADWTMISTWSDYTEQAQAPSTAIGFVPYDISTYYTYWFKTGTQPPIIHDTLYYFHRKHHTDVDPGRGIRWRLIKEGGSNSIDTRNEIELLAFLKEPGELGITIDAGTFRTNAPAGITSFKVPLPSGKQFTPVFSLRRRGATVISGRGRYTVLDAVEYPNYLYHAGMVTPEPLR
ncbi:MAG: hypothetical protein HZC28_14615 [Spirochaetes bacterium]|nr:hypothetical protein [Spirochaetota bacterium]